MSVSKIHKAWASLDGSLRNCANGHAYSSDSALLIFSDYYYVTNSLELSDDSDKAGWEIICTIQQFNDHCEMMKQKQGAFGKHGCVTEPDSAPVFTQAMADANELPPVGSFVKLVCNYEPRAFIQGTVLFASNTYCVVNTSKGEEVKRMTEYSYQPIQSPRDEAIKKMRSDIILRSRDGADEVCGEFYDANYRKLTPEQARMYDDKTGFFGEEY